MIQALYAAMSIPDKCHLGKRVYKKLFRENIKLGTTDKQALGDDVDKIVWRYTFKPTTIPVLPYEDSKREYHEVALIEVNLKKSNQVARLAEIIHRAIPYPLILVFQFEDDYLMSVAHKRFSKSENGAIIAEDFQTTGWMNLSEPSDAHTQFLDSLKISDWSHTHFFQFYSDIVERVRAVECARLSGSFRLNGLVSTSDRRELLVRCQALEVQIAELRSSIKKEQQFNRQVELNTSLKGLEERLKREASKL